MKHSSLESAFDTRFDQYLRDHQLTEEIPYPTAQVKFHPTREWLWDRAWIDRMVLLDLQGGGWVNGGHHRELGMANDLAKHNAALMVGWRPVVASTSMIENDPFAVIECLVELIRQPVLWHESELQQWTARIRNLNHMKDTVTNNGIQIERLRGSRYAVTLGKGTYLIGGSKMNIQTAQEQCLDLILRGVSPAATPKRYQEKPREFMQQLAVFA